MSKNNIDYNKAYYIFKKIRLTEEYIIKIYETDKIKSPVHLSIGQESIPTGVAIATSKKRDEVITGPHHFVHIMVIIKRCGQALW